MKATRKLFAVLMALVMVVALCAVTASAAEPTEKTLITSLTPTDPGNVTGSAVTMPEGWAGMKITVGDKDITVTQLGRWYTEGSGLTHNFLIAAMDGALVLDYGKCVLTVTAGTAEGFVYAPITGGGVTLTANTSYYIVSDYWGGADKFYTNGVATTTEDATIDGIVIGTYTFHEAAGISWGPLDIKYTVAADEGTGNEGTGNEGTGNEGTGNEGTGNEGTGNEGTGNEGTGTTPPPTGDAISAVVALLAVSGTALVVLKKKL